LRTALLCVPTPICITERWRVRLWCLPVNGRY